MKTIKIIADNVISDAIGSYFSNDQKYIVQDSKEANVIVIDDAFHDQVRIIHNQYPKAPILMLVRKGINQIDIPSFVKVMEKPLRLDRLKELIENISSAVIVLGPFRIYPKTRQMVCIKTDEKISLTEKEIEIILFLRNRIGQVIAKEDLLLSIWQYHPDITTHTLETHIYRLRRKLENFGIKDFLVTKESGYALEVKEP
jgi:DNA-binding response OmpR family regulator